VSEIFFRTDIPSLLSVARFSDFQLFKDQAPADSKLLMESLVNVWSSLGSKVLAVGGSSGGVRNL
jgi:hypothetical protein